MNAGQAGLEAWIPEVYSIAPKGYLANMIGVRRRYTRELPGDRYMYDEVVSFAYTYTPENAIEHFGLEESGHKCEADA